MQSRKSMKHTPGPWRIVWEEETDSWNRAVDAYIRGIEDNEGNYIFTFDDDFANLEANARLIAAAPEQHKLLKLALKYLEHPDVQAIAFAMDAEHVAKLVREAIAKAERR